MKDRFILSAILILAALATPRHVFGCWCMPPGNNVRNMREFASAYAAQEGVTAIFEGRVEKQEVRNGQIGVSNTLSMTASGRYRSVTVSVARSYRGALSSTVTVMTNYDGAACGLDFETGKSYLIYASALADGTLTTSLCSGTDLAEHSGPALRFLRGESAAPEDLLAPDAYEEQFVKIWTGTLCGRVYREGKPAAQVSVDLYEIREDGFEASKFSDENLSKPDGSFCIMASPGRYLLSADQDDYDHDQRFISFWPSGVQRANAEVVQVRAGERSEGYKLSLQPQQLYTVSFRVVTNDGSKAPEQIGVSIRAKDKDALAYWLDQNRQEDGLFTAGYVPPGEYEVSTYPQIEFGADGSAKVPPDVKRWEMAHRTITIAGDAIVPLRLTPVICTVPLPCP